MAEKRGQPHSDECEQATDEVCVCSCRGTKHGIKARHNRRSKLARMSEVSVGARSGGSRRGAVGPGDPDPLAGKASTPAQRQKHPVRVVAVQATRPAVPADLTRASDDDLARMLSEATNHPDGPDEPALERIAAEFDRRDREELYGRARGDMTSMSDDDVLELFTAVSRLDDPSEEIFNRLSGELERRDEENAAAMEQRQVFLARPVDQLSEDDLDKASQYASDLGDTAALERVMIEWDRRETERIDRERRLEQERQAAVAARLAEAKARAEADAKARVEAEAPAWEEHARREQAARDKALEEKFRYADDSELMQTVMRNNFSSDPASRSVAREAAAELARRKRAQEAWEARQQETQQRRRALYVPVRDLSDDELRASIPIVEAMPEDPNANDQTRRGRVADLRGELARRETHTADRQARINAGPDGPARVANPLQALGRLEGAESSYSGIEYRMATARLKDAKRRTFGLSPDADDKAIAAEAKADPRSAPEQAAMIVGWYRHLTSFEDLELQDYEAWLRGPADEPDAPPMRAPLPPASVAKPADVWRDVWGQARTDVAAGDRSTARRMFRAIARASGIPDSVGADDDNALQEQAQIAQRFDKRTDALRAAAYLAEFRQLAQEQGVDPSDRLRYGPPDRPTSKRTGATHWRKPTEAQDKRIDALVAGGTDYTDAYAQVLGLDADALRGEDERRRIPEAEVRKAYDEWVHLQWTKAEQETNGYLLSKAGNAAGIDDRSLFSGPMTNTVRRRASEELLRWWADNPRLTYTEFKAQMTGGAKAARDKRLQGGAGRDFV